MKLLLLVPFLSAVLLTHPGLSQTAARPAAAGEAPVMLADVEDEIGTAHLKLLKKQRVKLSPCCGTDLITLEGDGLVFRLSVAEAAKARSASAKVQQKYGRAVQQLRKLLKEKKTTLALSQPDSRDVEHLLAAWALPAGRVASIEWQGQPISSYTIERYGGGPNQPLYPEGQVFYLYATDRATGFYAYMNVPHSQ